MNSVTDAIEIEKINQLSVEDYIAALHQLENKITEFRRKMVRIHYESPNYEITAKQLAKKLGYQHHSGANLHYGRFAKYFCDIFQVYPDEYLSALVNFERINGEWHWFLRPTFVEALERLNWFNHENSSIIADIDTFRNTSVLDKTTTETVVQSRLGQGQFRSSLVSYWRGCAITNCQFISILRASHIKPWKDSTNEERLDSYNGLLLLPNLDSAFDLGFITFMDDGSIQISSQLSEIDQSHLGIAPELQLRKIEKQHRVYLEFHRNEVYRK